MARKRFQTGSIRLRKTSSSAYWEGLYREDVINEAGKRERKRKSVNLGSLEDVPSEIVARQKLAVILAPINELEHRPKKMMTFRGFVEKYRALKLANKKGTTVHGYETNIRAHYLPAFGDMQLSNISIEVIQTFLNQKAIEGKAVHTLKNLKWGLVWLVAITCVRPDELAFKWKDLDVKKRMLWIVRAVNRGKLHTPKYHRLNRPIRLTKSDVQRLLALKSWMKAEDDDWIFPNSRKTGPICHEGLLSRRIQPIATELGLPHITWRLLRHWGATQMVEAGVPLKAAQERMGHSRPDILLKYYAHVLDESADMAATTLSGQLSGAFTV